MKRGCTQIKFSSNKDALQYIPRLIDFINLTNMLYHGNVVLLILLLKSQLTKENGYNCSDFEGHHGSSHPLVECPPAKFMLKDNLVECFDNYTKNTYEYRSNDRISFLSDLTS